MRTYRRNALPNEPVPPVIRIDDPVDARVDRRADDVLRADDVRLDALERVVLRGVDLLHRGGVDDHVDAVESAAQPRLVADVADEVAQPVVVEQLAHLVLLQLVAAEDDDALRVPLGERVPQERAAEGPGGAGDQDGRTG